MNLFKLNAFFFLSLSPIKQSENQKRSLITNREMANSLTIKVITHLKLLNFARVCNTIYKRISEQEWTSGNRARCLPPDSNFRLRLALLLYEERISNLREIFASAATLFQRFRGFPDPGFQWERSSSRKFFLASPSAPRASFLPRNSWLPALGSFYIRSRFTAPRREVVRFSTLKAYFQCSSFSFDMSLAVSETRH